MLTADPTQDISNLHKLSMTILKAISSSTSASDVRNAPSRSALAEQGSSNTHVGSHYEHCSIGITGQAVEDDFV